MYSSIDYAKICKIDTLWCAMAWFFLCAYFTWASLIILTSRFILFTTFEDFQVITIQIYAFPALLSEAVTIFILDSLTLLQAHWGTVCHFKSFLSLKNLDIFLMPSFQVQLSFVLQYPRSHLIYLINFSFQILCFSDLEFPFGSF